MKFIALVLLSVPCFAQDYSPETATISVLDYSPETATIPIPDPQHGSRWTYPGKNIFSHLGGANHRHDIVGDYSGLTRKQAEDLHSDLHNTGQTLNAADYGSVATVSYAPELLATAGCPDGQCPVRMSPVRRVSSAGLAITQRSRSIVQRGNRRVRGFVGRLFQRFRR